MPAFMTSAAKIIVAVLTAGTLASCAADPSAPNQNTGAVVGAVSGGVLGAVLGGRGPGSRVAGALIGATAGGLLGSAIGASLDERDRQAAYAAQMQALESGRAGAPVGWRSDHTPYYGTVVPGPAYVASGRRCREYTQTVYINGRPEGSQGTACRNPDGTWTAIG